MRGGGLCTSGEVIAGGRFTREVEANNDFELYGRREENSKKIMDMKKGLQDRNTRGNTEFCAELRENI